MLDPRRLRPPARRLCLGGLAVLAFCGVAGPALAAPPATPVLAEPKAVGAVVHPADVHMEAPDYSDPDGDAHTCSDWEIWEVKAGDDELAWQARCVGGTYKNHIHLPNGTFVGRYSRRTELFHSRDYRVRVRFEDSAGETSAWAQRRFETTPDEGPGNPNKSWAVREPGYRVEQIAGGFQLPVGIAFVPDPGPRPDSPLFYVVEMHRGIKVVLRDGSVRTYARRLLNFNPLDYESSAQQGVTGIAVDPVSGDVFAGMLYEDKASPLLPKPRYPKVVRLHSTDGGRTASSRTTIVDMHGAAQEYSHVIGSLSIGPDRKLYIHNGDGLTSGKAQNLESYLGKVLRAELDGSPVASNPFYNAGNITARDYVFAYGFRNPFGGAWRASDGGLYAVENGPTVDRLAKVVTGRNYRWGDRSIERDLAMQTHAIYNWDPATAPVNIAFVQPETFGGSGFPAAVHDHAFVTTSGPTYAAGAPRLKGKRIVRFIIDRDENLVSGPHRLVEYVGTGRATAGALAAGPDGLYFSDLYKDDGTSPLDTGATIRRVRFVGHAGNDGTDTSEHLYGTPRNDVIAGGGGDDMIIGRGGADRLAGEQGDDTLVGSSGADRLTGGDGEDALFGDAGTDRLVGGRGEDRIRGAGSNDTILAQDGSRDRIRCGPGRDRVVADRLDVIAGDCERRSRGQIGSLGRLASKASGRAAGALLS